MAADATPYLVFAAGPVSIRPQFSVNQGFNDNLFGSVNRIEDAVTVLGAGINLQVGKPSANSIGLGYSYSQRWYAENHDLNSGDHSIQVGVNYRRQKLSLSGNDSLQFLTQPIGSVSEAIPNPPAPGGESNEPGEPTTPNSPPTNPEAFVQVPAAVINRTSRSGGYTLTYALSDKTRLYLQASLSSIDYHARISLLDQHTTRGVIGYSYRAFPKTSLFGEASFARTTSTPNVGNDEQPSSSSYGGSLGIRGRFTAKTSGEVRVGYEAREFGNLPGPPTAPVFNASMFYQVSPKRSLALSLGRQKEISSQYSRSSYTLHTVGWRLDQALGSARKWSASAAGGFSSYDYAGAAGTGNNYDRYSAELTVRYQIQLWLAASLGYTFSAIRRSSSNDDYSANQVTVSLTLGY